MRTIKELLEVMLKNQQCFVYGLCGWAFNLYVFGHIYLNEYSALKKYIRENRPANVNTNCWWAVDDIAPRIEWIKEQIKKLENENRL